MTTYQATKQPSNEQVFLMPDEVSCYKHLILAAKIAEATECKVTFTSQGGQVTITAPNGKTSYLVQPYVKPAKPQKVKEPKPPKEPKPAKPPKIEQEPLYQPRPRPINPANPLAWRGKPSADGWMKITAHGEGEPSLEFLEPKVSEATKKMGLRLMVTKPAPWHFHCITVPLAGGAPTYTDLGDVGICRPASGVRGETMSVVDVAKAKAPSASQPSAQYLVKRNAGNQFWYIAYKRYSGMRFANDF